MFSVSNDRMNIFYSGVDNPVSIAVENVSLRDIIVKPTFGKIRKEYGKYTFHSDSAGVTHLLLYRKSKNKFIKIGESTFRVKLIPPPTFKIGSGKKEMSMPEISSQQYVRAEVDGDIDVETKFLIERYDVYIVTSDSLIVRKLSNIGNKLSLETIAEFHRLRKGDLVIFKNIIIEGYGESETKIEDRLITIF